MSRTSAYTAFVADMSYFSGKLEAYLRYKEIEYDRQIVDVATMVDVIYEHTGLMKVPAVRCPDGQWLRDTTPMIAWFEAEHPRFPVIPSDPAVRFLSKLVEDYADEWCWRAALYWRWMFPDTARLLGARIASEVMADWPFPTRVAGWYYAWRQRREYLTGDGLSDDTEAAIRDSYPALLEGMTMLLRDTPYLLGSHPTLVDFGFMGPMFRHYALDPAPAKRMRDDYPAVFAWVARVWNARGSDLGASIELGDFSHTGWTHLLRDVARSYWPWMLANARAWQAERGRFDIELDGVRFRDMRVVHYRVYCLEMLQRQFAALPAAAQSQVRALLEPHGEFAIGEPIASGLREQYALPLPKRRARVSWLERAKLTLTGTPWDMPRPFR